MPSKDTFSILPIWEFVWRYLNEGDISIDPFARNFSGAYYTNDLNPETDAQYHMDAFDFLVMLRNRGVLAKTVIFDPPYSPRQIKECYDGIGHKMTQQDGQRTFSWAKEKNIIAEMMPSGGIFLYFGWNTNGMGYQRGFMPIEILIVNHGPGHSDTLCMAERKIQTSIF